jgi:thiamine-phosphate pyrophosphorylase
MDPEADEIAASHPLMSTVISALPALYVILDISALQGRPPQAVCRDLLAAGVRLIQVRHKQASSRELFAASRTLAELVRGAKGIFLVNDRADVARVVDADGVHVGQEDLPVELARRVLPLGKCVGCSTHNLPQVREAEGTSADYIAFGPIFPTRSKEQPDPVVGLEGLRAARRATRKPLVAIGGITRANARDVIAAGADSVAVIADLLDAPDVGPRAREFLRILGES